MEENKISMEYLTFIVFFSISSFLEIDSLKSLIDWPTPSEIIKDHKYMI